MMKSKMMAAGGPAIKSKMMAGGGAVKSKMMAAGGAVKSKMSSSGGMPMVTKNGKKVPAFLAKKTAKTKKG